MKFTNEDEQYWSESSNSHWIITCKINNGNVFSTYCSNMFKGVDIVFPSVENAYAAIKAVGEDRIKKYYLRIKEK